MRAFNIAADKILEREYCQVQVRRQLALIAAAAAFTLLVASVSWFAKTVIRHRLTDANSRLAAAEARCAEEKRELNLVRTSLARNRWQTGLAAESGKRLDMLAEAISRVPDCVWLDSVGNVDSRTGSGESGMPDTKGAEAVIVVTGRAADLHRLTDYIDRLRAAQRFAQVRLQSVRAAQSNSTVVDFAVHISPRDKSRNGAIVPPQPGPGSGLPEIGGSG